MLQVRERDERRGNPFLEVLARPGAWRFSVAGAIGRMPMSMFGLGTVLLIASVTGSYGLAGIVAATGSVGYAVCAPQAARLADRLGQRRVLRAARRVLRRLHAGAHRLCRAARPAVGAADHRRPRRGFDAVDRLHGQGPVERAARRLAAAAHRVLTRVRRRRDDLRDRPGRGHAARDRGVSRRRGGRCHGGVRGRDAAVRRAAPHRAARWPRRCRAGPAGPPSRRRA